MNAKLTILFVGGAILLAQYCAAYPVGAERITVNESIRKGELELARKCLTRYKVFLMNLSRELETMTELPASMGQLKETTEEILSDMREYDSITGTEDEKNKKLNFVFLKCLLFELYYSRYHFSEPLRELLKRNNFEKIQGEERVERVQYIEAMKDLIAKHIEGLSADERHQRQDLISWFNDFKKEEDNSKKYNLLAEFADKFTNV